jgi:hypothetical protein
MIAEYRYTYTADLMIEGLRRYRQRHHQRYWLPWLKSIGFVGMMVFVAFSIYARLWFPGLVFSFFLVLLLSGPRLDYFLLRRRHRKSPFFNSNVVVQVSESGCIVADANSRSELSWSLFTGGHRFHEGILVLHGPQQFQWWPDACLTAGSIQEVDALLRAKVPKFSGSEQGAAGDARNAHT